MSKHRIRTTTTVLQLLWYIPSPTLASLFSYLFHWQMSVKLQVIVFCWHRQLVIFPTTSPSISLLKLSEWHRVSAFAADECLPALLTVLWINLRNIRSQTKCRPQMPWSWYLVGAIKSNLVVFTKCIHCLLMDPSGGNICMLCPELLLLETPQPDTAHIRPMFDCWQVATVCKWLHRMLLSIYQSLDGKPPY